MTRGSALAQLAAGLAAVAAVVYLIFFLVGPVYTVCSTQLIAPGQTVSTVPECHSESWIQTQFSGTAPRAADLWLRPGAFLAVWTLAPIIALVALRKLEPWSAVSVVAVALAVELTSVVSMGGGFVYALLCGPLLLIALTAAAMFALRSGSGPARL